MDLRYDEDFVEAAAFLCVSGRRLVAPALQVTRFHRDREKAYGIPDPDERNTAFFRVHLEWFREWGLERLLTCALDEMTGLRESLDSLAFRKARGKNEEGAELYVQKAETGGGSKPTRRNAVVALRMAGTADISRFLRIARVVDDPMSIIDDLENGEVSPDSVAGLQQVYPRLYEQIRIEAMRHVAESETPISHESLVSLGILLGIPTTPSLHPDIMRAMQASYALPAPPPPSARRPPRLAEGLQSGAQSVEARGA